MVSRNSSKIKLIYSKKYHIKTLYNLLTFKSQRMLLIKSYNIANLILDHIYNHTKENSINLKPFIYSHKLLEEWEKYADMDSHIVT
jgi:hypothetical protein